MATPRRDPQVPRLSSLQGSLCSSRTGVQSKLLYSEKAHQACWSSFPMGQKPKNTFRKASSYLLEQLIHRYLQSEVDRESVDQDEKEGEGEGEAESETSSESEMLNSEVCLPPTPHPLASFSRSWTSHQPMAGPSPRALHLQEHLSLSVPRPPPLPSHFCYPVSLPFDWNTQVSPLFFFGTFDFLRVKLYNMVTEKHFGVTFSKIKPWQYCE